MQSIGVLGGTFDPPHIAHLILASEALAQLELERVLWVLTPDPPHKPDRVITPVRYRREMVDAAIKDNPAFEFSSVDLERDPPHYAVDTLDLLQQQYPSKALVYLMGQDSLRDLPRWHRPQEFLERCAYLGVMRRPDVMIDLDSLKAELPGIEHKVHFLDVPWVEISSSDIRQRAASGNSFRYYLPESVYRLILEHQLYQVEQINSG
jgi:nicotinate-nucleotide adenylyltransferase